MSWQFGAAGKAADIKDKVKAQTDYILTQSHMGEREKSIVQNHLDIINAHCDGILNGPASDTSLIAESSGHMSSDGRGNSTLSVRSLY
jgi:hypothetical protein